MHNHEPEDNDDAHENVAPAPRAMGELMLRGRCTLSLAFRYMRRQGLGDPRRRGLVLVPARASITATEPGCGSQGRSPGLGGSLWGGWHGVCGVRER
jgi:hypothetical protein